jgi:hypothetical protein
MVAFQKGLKPDTRQAMFCDFRRLANFVRRYQSAYAERSESKKAQAIG